MHSESFDREDLDHGPVLENALLDLEIPRPSLDEKALRQLHLDQDKPKWCEIGSPESTQATEIDIDECTANKTTRLSLGDRFNLAKTEISVRKMLLRWAIEWNCLGLIQDLWDTEPSCQSFDPGFDHKEHTFSGGSDKIFWAWNSGWPEERFMPTIWFLIDVKTRKNHPLRLGSEMSEFWWMTSLTQKHMVEKYEQLDCVLVAASAESKKGWLWYEDWSMGLMRASPRTTCVVPWWQPWRLEA